MVIVYIGIGYIEVLYLGRAPRTKETLFAFHEWHRVTRHPLVFRGLKNSQRTPAIWGVTLSMKIQFVCCCLIEWHANCVKIMLIY